MRWTKSSQILGVDGSAGKVLEVFGGFFARVFVAHGAAAETDDGEIRREQLLAGEVVERRDELAAGQVAGEAEDDHDARVGHARGAGLDGSGLDV